MSTRSDFAHLSNPYEDNPVTKALNPSPALLCKIGSIIVHIEELHGPDGHAYDKTALDQLLADPEFVEWRQAMGNAGFLPVKRR